MKKENTSSLQENVAKLSESCLSPLDLLPHSDFREKCIDLVLRGIPDNVDQATFSQFYELRQYLTETRVEDKKVVVFGGGTGLSNIIGGDSRLLSWARQPFFGLKEFFPRTQSIVCITDDGGSTGELIKDLPLIALGDIRHVMLSSVQAQLLQKKYDLSLADARSAIAELARIINFRFGEKEISRERIVETFSDSEDKLPESMEKYFLELIDNLFKDRRLNRTLTRAHCLGNLLLVSAIYSHIPKSYDNAALEDNKNVLNNALLKGIGGFSEAMGALRHAVMPCTTTPSQLRLRYTNGVEATGECKSGSAARGFPVDTVTVLFSDKVLVYDEIFKDIESADIIVMAPGSLYSSIIPIFQVPGIADAVRANTRAQKILVSNLWVQSGETDIAISDPERKFHVSDMINAYEHNIPGGTQDLFHEVLCLSLKDVPASILQNYALEGKIPIYLDKQLVGQQGYSPLECGIYSKNALSERHVIQHDPEMLAQAIKTVYLGTQLCEEKNFKTSTKEPTPPETSYCYYNNNRKSLYPSNKYRQIQKHLGELPISFSSKQEREVGTGDIRQNILEIIWKHQDIPLTHLRYVEGIVFIDKKRWKREQIWDKVYSFFDPDDFLIKIRSDQLRNNRLLEIAILIALGQSLLGNYAKKKHMENLHHNDLFIGKIYNLYIRDEREMRCYFAGDGLTSYLSMARMCQSSQNSRHYTRLVNGDEGFTPPGVLMGLMYAWYLDNRLASHIEYKMSLMKISQSDLIPEQRKLLDRRNGIIDFFRETVFRNDAEQI